MRQASGKVNRKKLSTAALAMALLTLAAPSFAAGDAQRGEQIYSTCSDCHSLDENEIGPKHRRIIGRRAGTVADYAYSPALRQSGIVWDEATLDKWLSNPQAMVPGSKMFFALREAQDRADVIAYLKRMSAANQ